MDALSEEIRFSPNQVCVAVEAFVANEPGDLGFEEGDKITIIRESEMLFWYIARNQKGEVGTVPGNFLELDNVPPPIPKKPKISLTSSYEKMESVTEPPSLPPKYNRSPQPVTEEERHMMLLMEREKTKKLAKGTLVVAMASYQSNQPGDLSFKIHEEMVIIEPTKDLCWYRAHKAYARSKEGVIPLTHIRLIYMSDDDEDIYQLPRHPGHEKLYEDKNDFLSNSGWFSHGAMALGRDAHYHCLARKADMNYDRFMSIKEAIYLLQYMNEKTFIGKADVLHEELASHFEHFGKRRKEIREIDDELCHHTNAGGWKLKVWPLNQKDNLELEFAKKIVEYDCLMSRDGGMNESLQFTTLESMDNFWSWLSPN